MLAPLLYMLALAGIGAAVMFSGYSQILRSNAEMTAVNAARAQLQSAGTTLSASSVLDTDTSSIVQPPAVSPFASLPTADVSRLPLVHGADAVNIGNLQSFAATGTAKDPHDAGVVDPNVGVRQLDPWGKFYIYCRWENKVATPSEPSIAVISAGPDGHLDTKCGDAVAGGAGGGAQGDDRIITSSVADTINRANVWQVSTTTNSVKFGIEESAVKVGQDGSLRASSLVVQEPVSGAAVPLLVQNKSGAAIFSVTDAGVANAPALSADTASFLALTVTNNANIGSLGVAGAATVGGTLAVTGSTTLASSLNANGGIGTTTITSAGLANLNTLTAGNSTITGTLAVASDFTVGGGKFVVGAASGDTVVGGTFGAGASTLASLSLGAPLDIAYGGTGAGTAAQARANLGLGTMATQNANAVAITGGTISGVVITGDITGNVSGSAGTVPATGVTGCCIPIGAGGTGAATELQARANLGADNASNLITGTLAAGLLPLSSVAAGGPYYSVNVDAYGRVVGGSLAPSSQWVDDGSGNLSYSGGGITIGSGTASDDLGVDGNIIISGAAGTTRNLYYATGTLKRWSVKANGDAESGSPINTGSDFVISSFKDDGTALANVFSIARATSAASFLGNVTAPNFIGNLTGNVTGDLSGRVSLPDGSVDAPALSFANEPGAGLYRFIPGGAGSTLGITAGGKDVAQFSGGPAAVNYLQFGASRTAENLTIGVAGLDTDIGLSLSTKGNGVLNIFGTTSMGRNRTEYLTITGGGSLGIDSTPTISAAYIDDTYDPNIDIALMPKGTGGVGVGVNTRSLIHAKLQVNSDAAVKGLVVEAASGQTANLFEAQNNGGTALTVIDPSGNLGIGTGATALTEALTLQSSGDTTAISLQNAASSGRIYTINSNNLGYFSIRDNTGGSPVARVLITPEGNVGIGYGIGNVAGGPNHRLDVAGNIGLIADGYINFDRLQNPSDDGDGGYGIHDSGGTVEFKNRGGAWSPIQASGSEAYFASTTSTSLPLVVRGGVSQTADLTEWKSGGGAVLAKVDASGNITAPTITQSSDQRLKTNIKTVGDGLDTVLKLRGVSFNWKKDGKPSMGVIAQEIERVMPSAVGGDLNGYKTVEYSQIFAPVIEAIKELKTLYDGLVAKIEKLAATVADHTDRITKLEHENAMLREAVCGLRPTASFCRP